MSKMEDSLIYKRIQEMRPNLSPNSIKTYYFILNSLYKNNNRTVKKINLLWFNNQNKIIEILKDEQPKKRKTILSALIVITDDKYNSLYKQKMKDDIEIYNKDIDKNLKDDKQNDNWITQEQIKTTYNELYKQVEPLFKKDNKTMEDMQNIQLIIILGLYYFIPPRRLMDYTELKLKNYDKEADNYKKYSSIYLNQYKTAKTYGEQIIKLPPELNKLINMYIKFIDNDYLLFDKHNNKLTSITLNQRLNKIFDNKNISVNNLRHSFITEKYDALPSLETIKENSYKMGHDMNTHFKYIKH
jgi:hypothetical protein